MTDWLNNICWLTDSYKVSHFKQYPLGTRRVFSYFESRSGSVYPEVCVFGLQYFLQRYLCGEVVTDEKIDAAETLFQRHLGGDVVNRAGWKHIVDKHVGRLPMIIKAVPEGTIESSPAEAHSRKQWPTSDGLGIRRTGKAGRAASRL